MTRRRFSVVLIASLAFLTAYTTGAARQAATAPEYGPAKGTLVIVGGGNTDNTGIMEKFVELGGGPNGKFVIVPTAGGNIEPGRQPCGRTKRSRSSGAGSSAASRT